MCENQFITLNQERRKDINSIIHSNRFDFFEDYKVYVYSQKGHSKIRDFGRVCVKIFISLFKHR